MHADANAYSGAFCRGLLMSQMTAAMMAERRISCGTVRYMSSTTDAPEAAKPEAIEFMAEQRKFSMWQSKGSDHPQSESKVINAPMTRIGPIRMLAMMLAPRKESGKRWK